MSTESFASVVWEYIDHSVSECVHVSPKTSKQSFVYC